MVKRPQSAIVGLLVRMREPLRKKLELAAKKRGVSLNAEVNARLERSFEIGSVEEALATHRAELEKSWAARFAEAEASSRKAQSQLIAATEKRWASALKLSEARIAWNTIKLFEQREAERSRSLAEKGLPDWTDTDLDAELETPDERQHHPTRQK